MRWQTVAGLLLLGLGGQALVGCRCEKAPPRRSTPERTERVDCEGPEDCEDEDPCTLEDCVAGRCTSAPAPRGIACGDVTACGAGDRCDGRGRCVAGAGPQVDDGNPCTVDTCDPERGVVHTPVPVDDGDACTVDRCEPSTGELHHEPIDLDDGDDCTFDSCAAETGVAHRAAPPLTVCGTACGAGYHAASRTPSGECPGGLRTHCMPDCGATFYSCDAACPRGYHPASRASGGQCGEAAALVTFCKKSDEASLTTCAAACPAGYRRVRETPTRQCGDGTATLLTCVR